MNISWSQFGNAIITNAKIKRVPIVAQFELTSRCNLRCKMCYVCNKANAQEVIQREKTTDEWINLAKQARDAGVLYILLTGGEVFLRDDFREIYEAISQMGFSIQFYTNGTLITPEIAKWLGKRPPSKVSVTLYGASEETYKNITGSSSAFHRALQGIDLLKAENILVNIRTTIVKGNRHDAKGIFDIAQQKGITYGMVQYISPRREEDFTDPLAERLTPEETLEYSRDLATYIRSKTAEVMKSKAERKDSNKRGIMKADIDNLIESTDDVHPNSAFSCTAGHSSFWVTWDGRMTPCGMMAEPAVDVFHKDFAMAWEELKDKCDLIPKNTVCESCETRHLCVKCPAKLKLETGTYTQCSEYLREMSQCFQGNLVTVRR